MEVRQHSFQAVGATLAVARTANVKYNRKVRRIRTGDMLRIRRTIFNIVC